MAILRYVNCTLNRINLITFRFEYRIIIINKAGRNKKRKQKCMKILQQRRSDYALDQHLEVCVVHKHTLYLLFSRSL